LEICIWSLLIQEFDDGYMRLAKVTFVLVLNEALK
jgi:hypothetical protein